MITVDNKQFTNMNAAFEGGHQLKMYQDSKGIWTVGVGHNIQDNGISLAVSEMMHKEDLQAAIRECYAFRWWRGMDDVRQAAIVDMVFNMGMPTFKGFKNTIYYLSEGMYNAAAKEVLIGGRPDGKSGYYHDTGRRAEIISKMIETGEWQ